MNQISDLKELKKTIDGMSYSYCDLIDVEGKKLVIRNHKKPDFNSNLEKIIKKVNSPAIKKGSYLIRFYVASQQEPDVYVYHKGGVKTISEDKPMPIVQAQEKPSKDSAERVLTWTQALSYQKEISELTFKVQLLERERDDWKVKYNELLNDRDEENDENVISEAPLSAADSIKSIIENVMVTGMPVLDRLLSHREKKLDFEMMKFGITPKQRPQQQQQQNPNNEKLILSRIDEYMTKLGEINPEVYDEIEEATENITDVRSWLIFVRDNYQEIFPELEAYINQAA